MSAKLRSWRILAVTSCLVAAPAAGQVWEVSNRLLLHLPAQPQTGFGSALAVGDVDGDGHDDIVVGAPDHGGGSGAVDVYRGTSDRSLPRVAGILGGGFVRAGQAVAIGNFDGVGIAEIAVSFPGRPILGAQNAGDVTTFHLNFSLLLPVQTLSQNDLPPHQAEANDWFGWRLEVGDFNDDTYDDLVVGVPFEDVASAADRGVIHVFYGGLNGLRTDNAQTFSPGSSQLGEAFGWSLAAADFNDDGYDDLAVGAPFHDVGTAVNAGQVHVFYGSAGGLTTGSPSLSDSSFLLSLAASHEHFGYALAAGPFDESPIGCAFGPCYADLAIGVPGQTIKGAARAGRVWIAKGSASGLVTVPATDLSQLVVASTGPEPDDHFGRSLAAGRLDPGPFSPWDLVIGAPTEDYFTTINEGGVVHLVFGAGSGLNSGRPDQTLDQKAGFLVHPPAHFDNWGHTVAIGDLDNDGWGDLVVGVPGKDHGGLTNVGVVQVLFGALFADGFESGGFANWTTVVN